MSHCSEGEAQVKSNLIIRLEDIFDNHVSVKLRTTRIAVESFDNWTIDLRHGHFAKPNTFAKKKDRKKTGGSNRCLIASDATLV
jgi:hypothetical protein